MDVSSSTKRALSYSSTSSNALSYSSTSCDNEEENPPTFEVVMTDSCVDDNVLYIPRKICKHLPPILEHAFLHHCGKEWYVNMSVGDQRRFKVGWRLFVLENFIRRGFVVKFTLVDVSPLRAIFNVQVKGGG
ncbi:hypothetical protein A4A49_65927, partial [Nicotiana attenuata]